MKDDAAKPRRSTCLFHGDYLQPVAKVGVRPLGILLPDGSAGAAARRRRSRGCKLANWIADPANPLTARVMVNRIWGYHFGRGIVSTPERFRTHGRAAVEPRTARLARQPDSSRAAGS